MYGQLSRVSRGDRRAARLVTRLDVPAAAQLLPVRVSEVVSSEPLPARCYAGVIVVEVGRARIRIEGPVDSDNLRVVLERVG